MIPQKSDALFLLGSSDMDTALYAAELWHKEYAPIIVVSGFPKQSWPSYGFNAPIAEAQGMAQTLVQQHVPVNKILIEPHATNLADNFIFIKELVQEHHLDINSAIIVQRPHILLRCKVTAEFRWPSLKFSCVTRPISFEDYAHRVGKEKLINDLVAMTERIITYPTLGWINPQNVPVSVIDSYTILIESGFTRYTKSGSLE
jgi:uncharacterized SAM-binding protein YcdF (DUF218 family)